MTVRRALAKDLERLNALLFQVAKIHADSRPDIFKADTKKYSDSQLLEIINDDNSPVFVAVDQNDYVLGYAFCAFQITKGSLLLCDKKTLYIDDICVDENLRRQNIGKTLYDFVLNFAKQNGFDSITLNVWSLNQAACKFYKKCGMSPLKITMEKRL